MQRIPQGTFGANYSVQRGILNFNALQGTDWQDSAFLHKAVRLCLGCWFANPPPKTLNFPLVLQT